MFQLTPPSLDFSIPILYVSFAYASPVTIYIFCVFVGSIAMCETPITGRLSVFVLQLFPPSTDFQSPPAGDPTQMMFPSFGSKAIQFTRPFPLFLLLDRIIGVLIGPLEIQFDVLLSFLVEYNSFCFFHSTY